MQEMYNNDGIVLLTEPIDCYGYIEGEKGKEYRRLVFLAGSEVIETEESYILVQGEFMFGRFAVWPKFKNKHDTSIDVVLYKSKELFLKSLPRHLQEEGDFFAFTYAKVYNKRQYGKTQYIKNRYDCTSYAIVTLYIPEDASRTSSIYGKCRCNKAKVLNIESFDRYPIQYPYGEFNAFNETIKFHVGKTAYSLYYNDNRLDFMNTGIEIVRSKSDLDYIRRFL